MRKPKFVYIYKDFDVNLRSCLQSVGASQDAAVIIILTNGRVIKRGIQVEWTTLEEEQLPNTRSGRTLGSRSTIHVIPDEDQILWIVCSRIV